MSTSQISALALRIKAIREAKGKDQETFADLIKVNRATVSQWENGASVPQKKKLELICQVFNVNPTYMNEGKGDMFEEPKEVKKNIVDEFLLRQLELKDQTIETLQRTVNHLLGMPGKPKGAFLALVTSPRVREAEEATEKDTYMQLVA